jgi:hypothetical protein
MSNSPSPFGNGARITGLALLVLAMTATVLLLNRQPESKPPARLGEPSPGLSGGNTLREQKSRPVPAAASPASRAEGLEALKQRWLASTPVDYIIRAEHHALAKESVELLPCTQELVELIEFLQNSPHMGGIFVAFDRAVEDLFRSGMAEEARQNLVNLPATAGALRASWSLSAGKGCPEEKLADFREALNHPRCSQDAFFGWALTIARTDPARALASSVQEFGRGNGSASAGDIYTRLARESPPGADFAALERLLPVVDKKPGNLHSDANMARHELLRKWAQVDITAAANYVLDNPEHVHPYVMVSVVEVMARDHPNDAAAWIESIPRGTAYDYAASVTSGYLTETDSALAKQVATQIADPKIRGEAMDKVRRSTLPDP